MLFLLLLLIDLFFFQNDKTARSSLLRSKDNLQVSISSSFNIDNFN